MSIAVAGATGNIGRYIASACLSTPFRERFTEVKILTRDPTKPLAQEFAQAGGTVIAIDYGLKRSAGAVSIAEALRDVVVVIDAQFGGDEAQENMDRFLKAAIESPSVKFYVSSHFGIDVRVVDFKSDLWDTKVRRDEEARSSKEIKTISIYAGLFLDDALTPPLGFDVEKQRFAAVKSADAPFSLTAKADVGLAVASIASALSQGASASIPEHVKIAGTTTTVNQVADLFNKAAPKPQNIKVETIPLEPFKSEAIVLPFPDYIFGGARVLMGEGKIDFTRNDNSLVNSDGIWQWTSAEDYAKAVQGRPGSGGTPDDPRSPLQQVRAKIGLKK